MQLKKSRQQARYIQQADSNHVGLPAVATDLAKLAKLVEPKGGGPGFDKLQFRAWRREKGHLQWTSDIRQNSQDKDPMAAAEAHWPDKSMWLITTWTSFDVQEREQNGNGYRDNGDER